MREWHVPAWLMFGAILALSIGIAFSGATSVLDAKLLDVQFRLLRAWFPQPVAREVAVVGIDTETIRLFVEPMALWHSHLNRFFMALTHAKPAVVGIDIVLPERSYDSILPGLDALLVKGLLTARRSYPVVLALTVDPAGQPREVYRPYLSVVGAQGAGFALFPKDSDGLVRRFDEHLGELGEAIPTLTGQMARALGNTPGVGLIDFSRGAPFEYVPLHRVLAWADSGDHAALARAFGGKPVLLGIIERFIDRVIMPVQLAAWEPNAADSAGVLLNAQALRNVLDRGILRNVPSWTVLLVCAIGAATWFISAGTFWVSLIFGALLLATLALSTWLIAAGWYLPATPGIFAVALALGSRHARDTIGRLQERRLLRASFSGYVSPALMDEILSGRLQPELGGVTKYVCVMFSDIRGYTTRSEGMTAQQVISFLNRYFERIVALIHEQDGVVISFMGDGIMAAFGAAKPLPNPCLAAFMAGRGMLTHVAELNALLMAEGAPPLEIGIGLHAGEAVVGHVGASKRHEYTAIGDVTNVASRIEGLTKEVGYRLVISRTVAEHLGEGQTLVNLGPMAIKGHSPVEVLGYSKV